MLYNHIGGPLIILAVIFTLIFMDISGKYFSCSMSLKHYKINFYSKVLPIWFQLFLSVQKILIKCFCFCEKCGK